MSLDVDKLSELLAEYPNARLQRQLEIRQYLFSAAPELIAQFDRLQAELDDATFQNAELNTALAAMSAELDALRQPVDDAEIAELKQICLDEPRNLTAFNRYTAELERAYRQVSADNAKLREYVQHTPQCRGIPDPDPSEWVGCDCGLAELLSE